MRQAEIVKLGFVGKQEKAEVTRLVSQLRSTGLSKQQFRDCLQKLLDVPQNFYDDPLFGNLARIVTERQQPEYQFQSLSYRCFGSRIDQQALRQMQNACSLPVSRLAALMPDAHPGYGLPIGGVLATEGAVIPYAVGVDIACRVKLSVLDRWASDIQNRPEELSKALENNTRFGIGAEFEKRNDHEVLERDWDFNPLTRSLHDLAWRQLGSSGSGNHFVEFGILSLPNPHAGLKPGSYLALVSHSGSRGSGSRIANFYSKLARDLHPELPAELKHLAWLDLNSEGAEYMAAMELMGEYASANHDLIHRRILKQLGAEALYQVENHHNFAWREQHNGQELIVHRKGATPAAAGQLGYIPGTMADPGYLVSGKGMAESLSSCAHGAGRQMSRNEARRTTNRKALYEYLREKGVTLLSAGLDESPHCYKDIGQVMAEQSELVEVIASFQPKIVKMAPDGEPAED